MLKKFPLCVVFYLFGNYNIVTNMEINSIFISDAGDDFETYMNVETRMSGKILILDSVPLTELKAKISISRGYILRLDFEDNSLWKSGNFYYLQMSSDLIRWNWVKYNEPIVEDRPYIVYHETIKSILFFKIFVSDKKI